MTRDLLDEIKNKWNIPVTLPMAVVAVTPPCTSAAPFSRWHRVNGQRVVEHGWPQYVPWWVAVEYQWQEWTWKSLTRKLS